MLGIEDSLAAKGAFSGGNTANRTGTLVTATAGTLVHETRASAMSEAAMNPTEAHRTACRRGGDVAVTDALV